MLSVFVCLFLALGIVGDGICKETVYKIGAIFDTSNEDTERAFHLAISEANNMLADSDFILESKVGRIDINSPFQALNATCSMLEYGIVGIVAPFSKNNYKVVQSVCDDKDVPLLMLNWDDELLSSVVNLYPHQDILNDAYISILQAWSFQQFVILYENNESLKKLETLIELLYRRENKVVAQELNQVGNYRSDLKELAKAGATHFFIDCSKDVLQEVLRQAQQVSMMSEKYNFFITNLDLHTMDLSQYQYGGANITGIRFCDPDTDLVKHFAQELFNEEIITGQTFLLAAAWTLQLETLLIRDAVMMMAQVLEDPPENFQVLPMDCDLDSRWNFGSTLTNLLHDVKYPGVTGIIKFDVKGHRSSFGLDVLELAEGGIRKVAKWNSTDGLHITRTYPADHGQPKRLSEEHFRVLISQIEPFAMNKESVTSLTGNDRYVGFAIDLIEELSVMEGFNYTFIDQPDKNNGGYNNKTKMWEGMIGKIYYNRFQEADLAIGDMTITSERQKAVDFATPFMTLGISILYHKPTKAPPSFFSFADPFALEVWELLVAAYFGVSLVLYILGRICASEWSNPYPCIQEPEYLVNQLSLRNCFWFTTAAVMQQGSEIAPVAVATRMVAGVWWFFTLIMVSSYTANLAAFLTTETPQPHFKDVFELLRNADKYKIKYGARKYGSTKYFFRDSHIKEYQQIYKYIMLHEDEVMVEDPKVGVAMAEETNYAFFMESTSIEYEIQRRCNLTGVGDLLDEKSYGIAMRKDSPYRNTFNTAISTLQDSGKLAELKRKWWEEKRGGGSCHGSDESTEAKALDLKSVAGVFWVTIGGTLAACVLVFIEMILHVMKESIKRKTPFWRSLKDEFKFYFKFSGMVKPVTPKDRKQSEEGEG